MDNPLLGKRLVIKATEVRKGDFLVHQQEQSAAEVIDVVVSSFSVVIELAVKGCIQLDPTWDVVVHRKGS